MTTAASSRFSATWERADHHGRHDVTRNHEAAPADPGRRSALAIGIPVCLLLTAGTGLSLVADFGEGHYPVSYTAPASARSLSLNVASGQLMVRSATSGQATLTGTARYSLIRSTLSARTVGGATAVRYHCPVPAGDCELDATVSVPRAMPVSANTDSGNATVTGTTGPVTLSSGGGNLSTDHTSGPLTLNTNGGNIQATGVRSASVTTSTGGGDIEIVFTSVPHDVHVNTSGGNITLVLPPGTTQYHVPAHTAGGSVSDTLPQNTSSPYVITAASGGGDITLRQQ